jgi:hypothetical protein
MRFKLISTALTFVLALAVVASGQTQQAAKPEAEAAKKGGAPKLAISKTQHDFGQIKQGTLAQYSFTLKNEGTADLVINNVAPS